MCTVQGDNTLTKVKEAEEAGFQSAVWLYHGVSKPVKRKGNSFTKRLSLEVTFHIYGTTCRICVETGVYGDLSPFLSNMTQMTWPSWRNKKCLEQESFSEPWW